MLNTTSEFAVPPCFAASIPHFMDANSKYTISVAIQPVIIWYLSSDCLGLLFMEMRKHATTREPMMNCAIVFQYEMPFRPNDPSSSDVVRTTKNR